MENSADFLRSSQGRGVRPREVSLSNRRETGSLTEPGEVGVDRVSVSFEVYDWDSDFSKWGSATVQHSVGDPELGDRSDKISSFGRSVEVVPGVSAFVGVRVVERAGGRSPVYGKFEFNPSRIVDPGGVGLSSVGAALDAFWLVVSAADCVVAPLRADWASSYRLKRLDVAKDFHSVLSPSALIRGLAPIQRPWSRKNLVHADPARNGAQTLMVGSNSGLARLYDKAAQSPGVAAEGTVRFEIEGRSDWVSKYGKMATVADLSEARVRSFGRDRWEWSKMGVEVSSLNGVVEVVARSGLTKREQQNFVGWLVMQSTPYAYENSKATLAKFRKLQRELNIAVGPDVLSSVGFASRLDWDSGEVVTRVASA